MGSGCLAAFCAFREAEDEDFEFRALCLELGRPGLSQHDKDKVTQAQMNRL